MADVLVNIIRTEITAKNVYPFIKTLHGDPLMLRTNLNANVSRTFSKKPVIENDFLVTGRLDMFFIILKLSKAEICLINAFVLW